MSWKCLKLTETGFSFCGSRIWAAPLFSVCSPHDHYVNVLGITRTGAIYDSGGDNFNERRQKFTRNGIVKVNLRVYVGLIQGQAGKFPNIFVRLLFVKFSA